MSDIALVCIGSILHAVTFTVGILVGTSLRKDVRNDSNEGTKKDEGWWHQPVSAGNQGGSSSRGPGGAKPVATAHLPVSAPVGRGSVWE
jgi:hypothetical protein